MPIAIAFADDNQSPKVLQLYTDKQMYQDGDLITINGKVSKLTQPQVIIRISDPFGMPTGFYFSDIKQDLSFSTSFPAKHGVNFKIEGAYSVTAHYETQNNKVTIDFDFVQVMDSAKDVVEEENETVEEQIEEETRVEESNVKESNIPEEEAVEEPIEVPNIDLETPIEDPVLEQDDPIIEETGSEAIFEKENPKVEPNLKSPEKEPSIVSLKPEEKSRIKKHDIDAGKLLNELTLNCDTSEFQDLISYGDNKGPAFARLCKYQEAIAFYDQILDTNSINIDAITNKGSALFKLGQHQTALGYYDKALQLNPNYINALNNKANALAELGNVKEAVIFYDKALKVDPDNLVILENNKKAEDQLFFNEPNFLTSKSIHKSLDNSITKTIELVNQQKNANLFEQISKLFNSFSKSLANLFFKSI